MSHLNKPDIKIFTYILIVKTGSEEVAVSDSAELILHSIKLLKKISVKISSG